MLHLLLLAVTTAAANPKAFNSSEELEITLGDPYIVVNAVELPGGALDPSRLSLVLHETVKGCRRAVGPTIERQGTLIKILPQSEPSSTNRAPCSATKSQNTEIVSLGSFTTGSYRVLVLTERSRVAKVLNIY